MFKLILLKLLALCFVIAACGDSTAKSNCPRIKLKRQWGARLDAKIEHRPTPVKYVIVHHTVTPSCTKFIECSEILQNMQNHHIKELDFNDIGYNFLIGNDGIIYEGAGWRAVGAHTLGYNKNGLGIAFIGDFNAKIPHRKALNAAKQLLQCGVESGELERNFELFAASQVRPTKSPGLMLYNEIQEWDNWTPNPGE